MLSDYRAWLASELALLGNASHHAYAFGQANMAKRALERLDAELAAEPPDDPRPGLSEAERAAARAALERLRERDGSLAPALETLVARL